MAGSDVAILGLHHVGLSVPDLDSAEKFYTDAFGFRRIRAERWTSSSVADRVLDVDGSAADGVSLWTGNAVVELFAFASPRPEVQGDDRSVIDHGINHLCLEVTDIHDEVVRLESEGMRFHSEPVGDAEGWFVYGRDPWGNAIELLERHTQDVPGIEGWEFRELADRTYD